MKIFKATVLGLAIAFAAPATAQTFLTSPSDPSLSGSTVEAFETFPDGGTASITSGNVTFTGNGTLVLETTYGDEYNTSGRYLTNNSYGFTQLLMGFAAPVSAFGFNWGASNEDWTLAAYDSSSNLIASYNLPQTWESNAGDFFGIAAAGISSAVLTQTTSNLGRVDYSMIDNFRYSTAVVSGVPEPGTWAMLLFGFGGIGYSMRRSRKSTAKVRLQLT